MPRDRAAIYAEIQRRAFASRRPGDSNFAAIRRFLETPYGARLHAAYVRAPASETALPLAETPDPQPDAGSLPSSRQ